MRFALFVSTLLIIFLTIIPIHAQFSDQNPADSPLTIQEVNQMIAKWRAEGKTAQEIDEYLQNFVVQQGPGAISGTVFQSDGINPLPDYMNIIAYDEYGFYASSSYLYAGENAYAISGLAPGWYYVQVSPGGNFVGEFYDDTGDWRQATLVAVAQDSETVGIDFLIAEGKVISGKILDEYSLDPPAGVFLQFLLYDADARLETDVLRYHYIELDQTGRYNLQGLAPGDYKLKLYSDRYQQTFYQNKTKLAEADVLSISSQTDTLRFINFLLKLIDAVQDGYEPNGTYQTAYQMSIGDSVMPQINPAGDIDYFTINGVAGDSVMVLVKANSIGSTMYPSLAIFDSSGINLIAGWVGPDIQINNILVPYTGQYFFQIRNNNFQVGGKNYYYTFKIKQATTTLTGSISGNVYLDNLQTPYNRDGYYIYLSDAKTGDYISDIYTSNAHFQIDNVPVGRFKIYINTSSDTLYLSEWFDNVRTREQATEIEVTAADTLKNIDFILDRGGSISGRVFLDDLSTDFTSGGFIYVYDINKDFPFGISYLYSVPSNDEGLYLVSGLQPGQFKVGFAPNSLTNEYPGVWYDQVGMPVQGTFVDITLNDTTKNINFILRKGGRIQGFIHQPDDLTPISSDSLQVSLTLYDPLSGNVLHGMFYNTFSAGYRTGLLFPGAYKFQALAHISSLASWYYDGGYMFEGLNTIDIQVQPGTVHELNIVLDRGDGSISGVVYDEDGSTPTARPGRIYAYDASGHIVQSTLIGIDPVSGELLETGHYRLSGLKDGSYYLMLTMDYIQMQPLSKQITRIASALKDGSNQITADRPPVGVSTMKQVWYGGVVVDLENLLYIQYQHVPDGAMAVGVTEPYDTPNIDFYYVESAIEVTDPETAPAAFLLEPVYPNPFNPRTTLRYAVPFTSQVTIEIFDILGRKVSTVFDQRQKAGWHIVQWDGLNDQGQIVTSGTYFARLKAADQVSTQKMILLR